MTTTVNASYALNQRFGFIPKLDAKIRNLARRHQGILLGSGSGFGRRDSDIQFSSKKKAAAFVLGTEKIKPAIQAHIYLE
jgi:hypothetical protein